ncbi:MAG TPA: CoA ester lyase [Candidatus Acidoferrum sp.]|jgi:citrate lyase subunit beta/citryl-CoA lyase|nr:CoA ester lyase [Candidatus Acidoferrum sp.]
MNETARTTVRPRRSVLFMPGSNARALDKARALPADGLIFDLEDAVAPDAKTMAREQIAAALKLGGYGGRELIVRINGLGTPWGFDDLAMMAKSTAHAILIPKVESAQMVQEVDKRLADASAPASLSIWCTMETPLGILHAEEIAASSRRIECLVMGTSDLTNDLHAAHTRERLPMLTSLGLCLLAARAFALGILDGVYLDLADDDGFAHSCVQGKELGFDGKTLIHPKTIAKANEVFTPSPDEVAWSRKLIAAHADASRAGKGITVVDGKLIENLHVENAKRLVALADAIKALQGMELS